MAHILIMPRQGNTVESCIIVDWKVKEGEQVTDVTTVCEVETDKATFEIPAGVTGTILKILCSAGDDVPVLAPIAVIGAPGEDWQAIVNAANPEESSRRGAETQSAQSDSIASPAKEVPAPIPAAGQIFDTSYNSLASPRARNLAEKEALPLEGVPGTGPEGRIIERDVVAALDNRPALTAAAKAAGGNVPQQGTGICGRVTAEDIASSPSQAKLPASVSMPSVETPIKGIRKVISDRMIKSLSETAQYTLNASASVSKLQDIRNKMKTSEYLSDELKNSKITVNDLILFAVSRVLPRFTYMNSHKIGDILKTFEVVHIGVAVDTPRGLLVPVIRNANLLSLSQISSEMKRLAAACQNGTAKPEELSGSTFTVSNLGSLGITSFTPVLNTPEVAILGVCGIEMKPVVCPSENNSEKCCCYCEPHIGFSLTINHQVVDGAPAAQFLKALCDAVADIDILLTAG